MLYVGVKCNNEREKMSYELSTLTSVAIDAVLEAGDILRKGFGTSFEISHKPGVQNFVTEYDFAAEECIINKLKQYFPSHAFLAEESGSSNNPDAEVTWIIDPLDGTTNFAHTIPMFSISVGAMGKEGMLCGIIYQPMTQELFVAEKERGAFLNGSKIQVSDTKKFAGGVGATGFPRNIQENPLGCIDHFIRILKTGTIMRNFGSSAINIAYVAAGRFDAYWALSLHPWDISAGILLVEEAGGQVSTYQGTPYAVLSGLPLVATNKQVHREVLDYLK